MSLSLPLSKLKIDDFVDGELITPTGMRNDLRSPTAADPLQFFVRILSDHTHILHADPRDTVLSIHEKIKSITGIPLFEQRLIYLGKQLNWEQTLSECGVQNDAGLHLVGRMRSTRNPQSWKIINDVIFLVLYLLKNNPQVPYFAWVTPERTLKSMLREFLHMTPQNDPDLASRHLQIFTASSAPMALVMLYISSHKPNSDAADDAIRKFTSFCNKDDDSLCHQYVPIMMEFCRLLRGALGPEDSLYGQFRSILGTIVESIENEGSVGLCVVFPFLTELAAKLSSDLVKGTESASFCTIPSMTDVKDFITYVGLVKNVIKGDTRFCGRIQLPLREELLSLPLYFADVIINLHGMFSDLLSKMKDRMVKIEVELKEAKIRNDRLPNVGWQFLVLLKELNSISKIYHGCEEVFWESMKQRKEALCYLIVSSARSSDDHYWISQCKDATNSEARRHLAMLLIPEVNDDYYEQHEMLIDRENLLSESFDYFIDADLDFLRSGLFIMFKNEEATGHGVLREWFLLVFQEIFKPENPLFVACPNDHRRFFPNPASTVDPLAFDYFNFVGKMIALALMHKVQVGIVFDRIFFLQLGGNFITLEDIRDADPFIYNSCKRILEMDPEAVDRDDLGLRFVHEFEELGRRREVELCPDGKNIAVNSKNRRQYVEYLIQHRFVKRTAEQVDHFSMGFADIFGCGKLQRLFFQCLNLEDFDLMICGSEREICVDDWRVHTKYNGFDETDDQISWFWEIVGDMTNEQKKILLYFWTSIKYLPIEGFGGLGLHLEIYKNYETSDHLPSSHTCFYRLCFPAYPDMAAMRDRLSIITREHVSFSFGTW